MSIDFCTVHTKQLFFIRNMGLYTAKYGMRTQLSLGIALGLRNTTFILYELNIRRCARIPTRIK